MIILDLEIKDIGRHKHIKAETNSPVIGLLGKNGYGKSTILDIIKFAFTGQLEDKAETYVRHFGMEGGAKNGSVRIRFMKDGKIGTIFRQIGVTSKRELVWDGCKPVTAAKTIDTMLAEIFSANKDAVGTVVFIKQGELDKLLFGTATERADLFLKMLLLDFLPKRAELIRQKIEVLSNGITDYSALQDDLRTQRDESEALVVQLKSRLMTMPDRSAELANIAKWIMQADELNKEADNKRDLEAFIADRSAAFSSEHSRLQEALTRLEGLVDPAACATPETAVEALKNELHQAELKSSKLKTAKVQYNQYQMTTKQRAITEDQLVMAELKLQSREAKMNALPTEASVQLGINMTNEYNRVSAELANTVLNHNVAAAQYADTRNQTEKWKEADFAEMDTCLKACTEDASLFGMQLDFFSKMLASHMEKADCCPLCNSAHPVEVTAEMLEQTRAKFEQSESDRLKLIYKIRTMHAENTSLAALRQKHAAHYEQLQNQVAELQIKLNALTPPTKTIAEMEATLQEIRKALVSVAEARSEVNSLNVELAKEDAMLSTFTPQIMADIEVFKAVFETGVDPTDIADNRALYLKTTYDFISPIVSIVTNLNTSLNSKRTELEVCVERYNKLAHDTYRDGQVLGLGEDPSTTALARQAELKEYQSTRDGMAGQVFQAERNANDIRQKQADVERRVENDQKRRALVENLRQLKETLSRGGLPMTVMNHQFKQLVEIVQEHLADLGANFSVTADTERPISFCFTRTDEDSGYVMPQEKLSGGQRVRLTVAMLMAVQQLIIPEVGFLVLDEPSVHLDEEGVESLRELFQTLSQRMGSTGSQVIVCDHDQSLKSAFSGLIEIKN